MSSIERIQILYDKELNFVLSAFWDDGLHWKLGDYHNGFLAEGTEETVEKAVDALFTAAQVHFPGAFT